MRLRRRDAVGKDQGRDNASSFRLVLESRIGLFNDEQIKQTHVSAG